jgi:lysophospholipase L1-like esterase
MNTNPAAHTILCYGDSNTWGQKPDKSGRYPANIRWTGRMQEQLGDQYYVIEEGIGSRTTDLEYAKKPGRNGKTYLRPCLESHNPIDLVVLMLGTNDLKIEFDRSPQVIADAIGGLVALIREVAVNRVGKEPKVLVVSPVFIDDEAPDFAEFYGGVSYNSDSATKSHELGEAISVVAEKIDCEFFDASRVARPGTDGIHFSEAAHVGLAEALEKQVKIILDTSEISQSNEVKA